MINTATNTRPYVTVLKDLERKRFGLNADLERLQKDCAELDLLIAGIRKIVTPNAVTPDSVSETDNVSASSHPSPIKAMSTRWAILTIFGTRGFDPMGVGDILEALTLSGFPVTAKTRGNISAVLSRMVGFGEVANAGNSYTITDVGRRSLDRINGEINVESEREAQSESLVEGV